MTEHSSPSTPPENKQIMLMRKARASSSFRTSGLSALLWGGDDEVQKRRAAFERVEARLGTNDSTKLPLCYANTSREALYEQGLRMGKACIDDMEIFGHDLWDWITPRFNLINASPFGHKSVLFQPAIEHNGTEEQKAKWLTLAKAGKILGTYAQTELGHGSFIRGLETTATFDDKTDEFVVHSPTINSTKFWPAGLGFSSTHAVVMAQLVVAQKQLGPHLFIVPIRSLNDGKPLPGIRMGDVGLKMGFNEADNGYATFTHVRIPRSNMLAAHAQLSRAGVYITSHLRSKLLYSVMLLVRHKMPSVFTVQLAQAVTIATRYSVVRSQGVELTSSTSIESAIIDYKHQHFRLITLIAKTYAMFFASRECEAAYTDVKEQQARGDHSGLASLHALSAGLKAYVTSEAVDGAEDARKLCGGHGYVVISGLPDIIGTCAGGTTFEGENYVMWQQVGRYLMKQVDATVRDAQSSYLVSPINPNMPCTATGSNFLDPDVQLFIYRSRAHRMILKAHHALHSSKKSPAEAWNEHMLFIISASRAHIEYTVLQSFVTYTSSLASKSPPLLKVLHNLRSIFALSTITSPFSTSTLSFLETATDQAPSLTSTQLDTIRSLINSLLAELLPDVIALTDAWDFTDASLCSALGMWDGDIYGHIMRWVRQMPINQTDIHAEWKMYVEPVLKGKL